MINYVHIDEKWFYLKKDKQNYYLLPDRKQTHRYVKSKCFIPKVILLCAMPRPRHGNYRNSFLNREIGMKIFVETVMAKKEFENPPSGSTRTKTTFCEKGILLNISNG